MRCFVAVDLSEGVRGAVARAEEALRAGATGADVRWVAATGFHVTIQFLGEVPESRRDDLAAALAAAARDVQPFDLGARGMGSFPNTRRPRVVWVGIEGATEELAALATRVGAAMAGCGFPPEARPFTGHVTIGRVRTGRGLGALAAAIQARSAEPFGSWSVRDVVLYRSRLSPRGATYEALARPPLGR